ncbi:NAD(P)H-dependent flavin oxidoreductase [Burkholderia plantarii]|uniref:Nitronate monooxygenase n=1 Tax=Burkholderia plantarii TaxID=41899 RepID=A0A0B6RMW9_BURPL|nr:nitronate monooxygenase [Burkholderia plantarii]AJK44733.1 2-nitropropane dioxygenase family protein [Burkholderia plantarii]ALK29012.1 oxidoreductase, 2-nitropropane dioxygenase family protein [Burkholderia plantarii]GLZ17544.1 oxidoreductase [Burkholderia plantarii]
MSQASLPSTSFAERFGLRLPLVQAPMAGATSAAIVAAASNAGALGSLGGAGFAPERLAAEIEAIRAATSRPFAVNLFVLDEARPDDATVRRALAAIDPLRARLGLPAGAPLERYAPDFDAQLEVLVAARVPVASFTFGVLDAAQVARLHAAGCYVIGTATHLAEGLAWREAGADAISAQGAEAGGHRGTFLGAAEDALIGTMALVPQLVDATGLPVLAAGGIMDGRGIAAALALGAQAAQLGTAFLGCAEATIPAAWRERLVTSGDTATVVTRAISGRHARGIRNALIDALGARPDAIAPYPVQNALTQALRQAAGHAGEADYLSLWAGQGMPLGRRRVVVRGGGELTAAALIDALDAEWRTAVARFAAAR